MFDILYTFASMEDKIVALNRFFRERNMTTQDIAEKVGMSTTHILNLLSGRSKFIMKTACLFFDTFGLSPAWLMTGEGEMLGNTVEASKEVIGRRLEEFILHMGISKNEAARRIGIMPSNLYEFIGGRRTISTNYAARISTALGVSASWLLTGEGPMEVEGWEPPSEAAQHPRPMVTDGRREEAARLRRENAELREEVARLREQTERLMSVVENLTKGKA